MTDSIDTLARRHGFSGAAAHALAEALRRGGGRQAQFNHPELGGMGQWSQGGMLMIGAMNDHALKARVAALAQDLSTIAPKQGDAPDTPARADWAADGDWPASLGRPSTSGAQNGVRYAVFPDTRRLVIERDGEVALYDTLDHAIRGAAQSQGGAMQLRLTSQHGDIDLEQLPRVPLRKS